MVTFGYSIGRFDLAQNSVIRLCKLKDKVSKQRLGVVVTFDVSRTKERAHEMGGTLSRIRAVLTLKILGQVVSQSGFAGASATSDP